MPARLLAGAKELIEQRCRLLRCISLGLVMRPAARQLSAAIK
jgi:hypothetical protein